MKRPNLYDLQSRWDDERAAQRIAELRAAIRPTVQQDCRWMVPLLACGVALIVSITLIAQALA
jgi:hypothetical protein